MTYTHNTNERIQLGRLLAQAARAEQGVMCQYLFAGFSMKKKIEEGGVTYAQLGEMRVWHADIMRVARQEMEHLGLVQNLRTAIGEAPYMTMPQLPCEEEIMGQTLRFTLGRFSARSILRFALAEMPEDLQPDSEDYKFLASIIPNFAPDNFDALAQLYDEIRRLFNSIPEKDLFVGPPGAQFNTHEIFPGVIRGLSLSSSAAYQFEMTKVLNRADALKVIDQIAEEGEGAKLQGGDDGENEASHFKVFMQILKGLHNGHLEEEFHLSLAEDEENDPARFVFQPARWVVQNPTLNPNSDGTQVTEPFSALALELYEACHITMMMMLARFFSAPENPVEMAALQQAVFFPMMTTIIRPLGEVLTLLPAIKEMPTGPCAGANFAPVGGVELSPHTETAFRVLEMRYADMAQKAERLLNLYHNHPPAGLPGPWGELDERLTKIHEQIKRSHMNLKVNYKRKPSVVFQQPNT